MDLKIVKRDGSLVQFDANKIREAVLKAFAEADSGKDTPEGIRISKQVTDRVSEKITEANAPVGVEKIQDMVEEELMTSNRPDVARLYVIYRNERNRQRKISQGLKTDIANRLKAEHVENQNANVDQQSAGGKHGSILSDVMKEYALDYCMSKMSRDNHLNNEIYIHDLDNYSVGLHNCLSIPFDDLLASGFTTRQADVRPANSVGSAMQLTAVIMQLQSLCQFGGVSATHIDITMVPYVRKSFYKHFMDGLKYIEEDSYTYPYADTMPIDDPSYKYHKKAYAYAMDKTEREVYQGAESLYHNLGTLQSRSGNQLPFSSINYGMGTSTEARMVTKALLEVSIHGIGKMRKTPIFPCAIFQLKEGINRKEGDPNYDLFQLALRSTAQRLYPNYSNSDWSGNKGYDPSDPKTYFSTMGCRTANGWDINGFKQLKDGRGNICPVTIILPTLAMEVKNGEVKWTSDNLVDSFMNYLEVKIEEAKDMLLERFCYIASQSPNNAKFMWDNKTMAGYDGENIISALQHGTLALGQLGLAETLQILIGKDHTTLEGMELAKRIEELFKSKCAQYKAQYSLNYGVYYTPEVFYGGLHSNVQ